MSFGFGGPVDPGWEPFKQGLHQHFEDIAKACPRWHPHHGKWYHYPLAQWFILETGLPALDPGSAIDPEAYFGGGRLVTRLKINTFGLDDVFTAVRDYEAKYRATHGPIVWNPVDGAWRRVVARPLNSPPQPVPPKQGSPPSIPPRAAELIRQVNALRDAGVITPSQADEAVQRILESVT